MSEQNLNIQRTSQALETGDLVALFELDLRPIGVNEIWRFTSNQSPVAENGVENPIVYRGLTYMPVDIETEGWEYNGQGQMPQPKIRIANATKFLSGVSLAYQDLIGAKLTRIRTYRQFLDAPIGTTPDPDASYDADIYVVEQKTSHDKFFIEWSLAAAMDQQGRMLPGRLILRETCMFRYRVYDPGAKTFNYDHVTCPYEGTAMYDHTGKRVYDATRDQCGKRLSDCLKRFGKKAELPFGGFPGVARTRI